MLSKCKSTIAHVRVQLAIKHHTRKRASKKSEEDLSPSSFSSSPEKKTMQVHCPCPHLPAHHWRPHAILEAPPLHACWLEHLQQQPVNEGLKFRFRGGLEIFGVEFARPTPAASDSRPRNSSPLRRACPRWRRSCRQCRICAAISRDYLLPAPPSDGTICRRRRHQSGPSSAGAAISRN
jgi:hypothetical protein